MSLPNDLLKTKGYRTAHPHSAHPELVEGWLPYKFFMKKQIFFVYLIDMKI